MTKVSKNAGLMYQVLGIVLLLAGCSSAPEQQSGQAVPVTAMSPAPLTDWQASVQANVQLIQIREAARVGAASACSAGFANAKSDIQFAMAALGQQACIAAINGGGAGQAQVTIQAPPEKPAGWQIALEVADRVLGRGLQALGLMYTKQASIEQTRANRDVMTVAFNSQAAVAQSGFAANTAIATGGFQMAGQFANAFATLPESYTISAGGDVAINGSSISRTTTTRTCTGTQSAPSPTVPVGTTAPGFPLSLNVTC